MLNALAFFFLLKQIFVGSCIKNPTPQRLSKATGVSVNTVKKYLVWLSKQTVGTRLKKGGFRIVPIIFYRNGKLYLSRVQSKYHITTFKLENNTLSEIKNLLYGKIIHSFVTAQEHSIRRKEEIKRIKTNPRKSEKRKYREYTDLNPNPKVSLSVRYICNRLSIGKSKLKEICNYLENKKLLKVIAGEKRLLRENGKILSGKNMFDAINDLKLQFPFCHIAVCSSSILVCYANSYRFY